MSKRVITDGGRDRTPSESRPQLTYDIDENEQPSTAIVRAVAALTDRRVLEIDPLYDVIDPNQLDRLLDSSSPTTQSEISFVFSGCEVVATAEEVRVTLLEETE